MKKNINWTIDEYEGIKFKYVINKDSKTYNLKLITHIPRGYYYSIFNEIGLMIEKTLGGFKMTEGTVLQKGKLYYTQNGVGEVVPFNLGKDFENNQLFILMPVKTHTKDVWYCGISRHIKDIAETEEEAKNIKYCSHDTRGI